MKNCNTCYYSHFREHEVCKNCIDRNRFYRTINLITCRKCYYFQSNVEICQKCIDGSRHIENKDFENDTTP